MFRWISAAALSLLSLTMAARAQQSPAVEALDGVDVVALLTTGKEVFGKSAHRSTHEGFDYLFASADTKAAFDSDPGKYAIQLGGACARMGGLVYGNPADYAVHDGKIYIFGSDACHKAFVADPQQFIPPTAPPMPTSSEAGARGRALLDRTAGAHGGAALDAATSYVETVTTVQKRPTGEVAIVTRNLWRFPGGARSERTIPLNAGPMTITNVVTRSGAWSVGGNGASTPLRPAMHPAVDALFNRRLLPILKARRDADLAVAALGPATIGAVTVERVRITRGGLDATLNIDAASGRAHSLAFVDRGDQGHVGEIVVTFADFRDVTGVTLPFVETATFKGAPSPQLSRKLDSAELNVPLDAALFTPPPVGK
jgi:YHS domain-containing protein